jgi:alkanesulfonate monooxygenase SsuD/methylene tetrahydromethanopterin reductase-like flavin-dependent oxidoreductase (luciferase family)
MGSFRFSSNVFGLKSRDEFVAMCRRAESYGYDTIFTVDHLGHAAPFQAAVAAAAATQRLRVGTLVVNVPFWNPALLAREIATADILTGGRLEVGLGSGHMKWEFDEAGIPWEGHSARGDRLAAAIGELSRLFAGDGYQQQAELRQQLGFPPLLPVQHRGFGGYGPPPGVFRLCTAAEADDRVRFARDCAGDRADTIEWHALVQTVLVTDDRHKAAADLAEQHRGTVTAGEILVNPFLFVGTIEEIAEQIVRNRDRYSFTYYTVHEPYLDAFAPVIDRVRALEA